MVFKVLALIIMLQNFYFAFLEMFLWTKNNTRRTFGLSIDFSMRTKSFGFCFGIFKFLLGCGFIFGFIFSYTNDVAGTYILLYAMFCAFISSLAVGLSFSIKFFLLQGLPAFIGLCFYFFK